MTVDDLTGDGAKLGFFSAVNHISVVFSSPIHWFLSRIIPAGIKGILIPVFIFTFHFNQAGVLLRGKVFQVGGNGKNFQFVNLGKLFGFSQGGTCHSRQFLVHAEVVLEGDGGIGHVFRFNFDTFFGFNRLVQAFGPAPSGHQAAGELIHDDHFTSLNKVVFVPLE